MTAESITPELPAATPVDTKSSRVKYRIGLALRLVLTSAILSLPFIFGESMLLVSLVLLVLLLVYVATSSLLSADDEDREEDEERTISEMIELQLELQPFVFGFCMLIGWIMF